MVERVKLEPTMEEIVVALRETRRDAGRVPPFTVVGRQPGGHRSFDPATRGGNAVRGGGAADNADEATSTDVTDLRDGEIERLLTDNARLNERVVFLLKIIEREQACNAEFAAERAAMEAERAQRAALEAERDGLGRDVKATLEAQLRPVLLVLLRLLEKQRADPPLAAGIRRGPEAARPATPPPEGAADLSRKPDGEGEVPATVAAAAEATPAPL